MRSRYFIVLISFLLFHSCSSKKHDMNWMLGTWQEKGNNYSAEEWRLVGAAQWEGFGYRFEDGDTVFTEQLRIFEDSAGKLTYRAFPDFEKYPVDFVIDSVWENGFRSVNLQNDYPTHIQYERNGSMLRAFIWGSMDGRFLSDTLNYFLETREDSNFK